MSDIIEIKVPDIGDTAEVDVIEVLVAEGDTVAKEQSLITVESDKASMEIPSTAAGVVKSIKVKIGDKVSEGTVILELRADAGKSTKPAAAKEEKAAVPAAQPPSAGAEQAPTAKSADAAEKGSAGSGGQATVVVPDIGDATDVEVIEVMVAVGDRIELEQSLITVESDKASMEVPSSQVGTVKEVRVKLGDKVKIGDEIVVVELDASAQAPAAPAEVAPNGEVRGADDAPAPLAGMHEPDVAPEAGEETSAPSAEATAAVVSGG